MCTRRRVYVFCRSHFLCISYFILEWFLCCTCTGTFLAGNVNVLNVDFSLYYVLLEIRLVCGCVPRACRMFCAVGHTYCCCPLWVKIPSIGCTGAEQQCCGHQACAVVSIARMLQIWFPFELDRVRINCIIPPAAAAASSRSRYSSWSSTYIIRCTAPIVLH